MCIAYIAHSVARIRMTVEVLMLKNEIQGKKAKHINKRFNRTSAGAVNQHRQFFYCLFTY